MLYFPNLDEFRAGMKWRRAAEAIERASRLGHADEALAEVTLSIGDSVTYRLTSRPDCTEFIGRIRYLDVRAVLDGTASIEIARVGKLQSVDAYSDLSDRQRFSGGGTLHQLGAGEIVVVEPGEAIRDVDVNGWIVVLRVRVEDGPS